MNNKQTRESNLNLRLHEADLKKINKVNSKIAEIGDAYYEQFVNGEIGPEEISKLPKEVQGYIDTKNRRRLQTTLAKYIGERVSPTEIVERLSADPTFKKYIPYLPSYLGNYGIKMPEMPNNEETRDDGEER